MARHRIRLGGAAIAQKWAQNTTNGVPNYKAGIGAVTESPGIRAAAQKDAWLAGINANADKWSQRMNDMPLQRWKDAALNKGANRIPDGVKQATPSFGDFMNSLLIYEQASLDQLNNANPRGARGSAQNKQRMMAWMDMMHMFKNTTPRR